MVYSDEEPKGRDIDTHSELSQVDQVSLPCQKDWETYKIKNKMIPYMDVGSTLEVKGDLKEGHSSTDEFDGEDL